MLNYGFTIPFQTEESLSQFNITPDVGSLKAISKEKEYVGEDKKLVIPSDILCLAQSDIFALQK